MSDVLKKLNWKNEIKPLQFQKDKELKPIQNNQ
jgi:hypothetical protein